METKAVRHQGPWVRRCLFDGFAFAYLIGFTILEGLQMDSEALLPHLSQIVWVGLGLSVVGALLSAGLAQRQVRTLGELIYAPLHIRSQHKGVTSFWASFAGIETLLVVAATVVAGWQLTEISFIRLLEADSFFHAMRLFSELAKPDWGILPKAILKIVETIYIAFMATAISVPIAFLLSFFMARNMVGQSKLGYALYTGLRIVFNVMRSVEPILWAIIFSIWVSFGPFAGMLALMIHSLASLSRQFSEIIEGVEDGPIEGIQSTGAGKLQTIWFAVVPQIVLPFISFTIFRWDINVRMATILGFVGGGGIGTMLIEYQGQAQWPQVGTVIVVIAAVVWVMDTFSAHVRDSLK